jgi:hypothetical protein
MGDMTWTTPSDLKKQVQKFWDQGLLLKELVYPEEASYPRKLRLKVPSSAEALSQFPEVRDWAKALTQEERHYRLELRKFKHHLLGKNTLPHSAWLDSHDAACALIQRTSEVRCFQALLETTRSRAPQLLPWLAQKPLKALEHAEVWTQFLELIDWMRRHPRPGIFLRQVDLPGIHSKFIEKHRRVLEELLDLSLPESVINRDFKGTEGFVRRYGFREKPERVRFRILDPELALFGPGVEQDLTLDRRTFSQRNLRVHRVFITENEVNFLAFPPVSQSLVIFGQGYGFQQLLGVRWLQGLPIFYWGDLDTHGFAILSQLRGHFPQTVSFLMDRETLLSHRSFWGQESQPKTQELDHLHPEEQVVYDDLRQDRLGPRVRLEQERIRFARLQQVLSQLQDSEGLSFKTTGETS